MFSQRLFNILFLNLISHSLLPMNFRDNSVNLQVNCFVIMFSLSIILSISTLPFIRTPHSTFSQLIKLLLNGLNNYSSQLFFGYFTYGRHHTQTNYLGIHVFRNMYFVRTLGIHIRLECVLNDIFLLNNSLKKTAVQKVFSYTL